MGIKTCKSGSFPFSSQRNFVKIPIVFSVFAEKGQMIDILIIANPMG
jgi:hypothetical protein